MDLGTAATLIIAIVPFDQVPVDFSDSSKASQFTGAPGTLQRAGEHLGEGQSTQPIGEPARVAFATFCQRYVGKSRELARERPRGFPVSCQVNYRKHFVHRLPSSFMCQWKIFVLKQRLLLVPPQKRGIKTIDLLVPLVMSQFR